MKAMVGKELKENLRNLLIWISAMLGMITIGAAEYPIVIEAGEEIMALFESLPPVLAIVFGAETIPVHTPVGYYIMMYFWYCIIAFTHAAVLGATIISKEERNRTAEFTFTRPFPRKYIVTSKIIAAVVNVAIITVVTFIGNIVLLAPQMEGKGILGEIVITLLSMFFIQILFLFTGLLSSAVFSSYKKALSFSALFVVFAYTLRVVIQAVGNIDYLNVLTPFMYFNGPGLVENGISIFYLFLTIVISSISGYLTYAKYKTRDLHN